MATIRKEVLVSARPETAWDALATSAPCTRASFPAS